MTLPPETSGAWVRAVRRQLGLSQVALAALLGVSNITVNRWEQGHASPRPAVRARLHQLSQEGIVPLPPGPAAFGRSSRGNLPVPPTSLLGREAELRSIGELLADSPLVTITGPGGAGKTRLALAAGRQSATAWPGGAWFVDLAAVTDPAAVLSAVARTLSVRESGRGALIERVAAAFAAAPMLLILDNCEHLLAACGELAAALLSRAGDRESRLLATSRAALGVAGERVLPLGALPATVARELFLQRSASHQPDLRDDARRAPLIAAICDRLDGLPLAIELAAARTDLLSVDQIAARLDHRFELLRSQQVGPDRQRTLETAIAWSEELLAPDEQRLLHRLGIFTGGFDLAAVEATHDDPEVLTALSHLSRHSLLVVTHAPGAVAGRYRLLESVAAFARTRLAASGEQPLLAERHARWYQSLAVSAGAALAGGDQAGPLAVIDQDAPNLIAALDWLTQQRDPAALAMVAALGPWWRLRGRYDEGLTWLARVIATVPAAIGSAIVDDEAAVTPDAGASTGASPAVRAAARVELGLLQLRTGALPAAAVTLTAAIADATTGSDVRQEARARDALGLVYANQRQFAAAAAEHEAAHARFLDLGDYAGAALSRHHLGNLANLQGDHATTEQLYREAWGLVQHSTDRAAQAHIASNLGEVAARTDRFRVALAHYEVALRLLDDIGDPERQAAVATNVAEVRLVLGDAAGALPLAAEAVTRFRALGNPAFLASALYIEAAARAANGDGASALVELREALRHYHQLDDWIDVVYCLEAIARLIVAGGDATRAAMLLGGVAMLRERDQIAFYPIFDFAGTVAAVSAALAPADLAAADAAGRELTPAALLALALVPDAPAEAVLAPPEAPAVWLLKRQGIATGVTAAPGSGLQAGAPVPASPVPVVAAGREGPRPRLSPRQLEVLRLVAAGASNREIGESLAMSERTVERHLSTIFTVLMVDRRAGAVARAIALGLIPPPAATP